MKFLNSLSSIWLRRAINFWPPFVGAGIKIEEMSENYRHIKVSLKLRWYNRNYVGTHFGGSMFAMTDPFYMLILLKNLGNDYIVWDKAAQIDFKKVGRGKLTAIFFMTEAEILAIKVEADQREKYIFDRTINILNDDNEIVASVIKTLYVRKK